MQPLTEISQPDQHKALRAFMTLTQHPVAFEAIYDLDEVLRKTALSQIAVDCLKVQPAIAAIIQERYLAPVPNLLDLLTYPENSLGHQFAVHMIANGFDPEFYRKREVLDDISYVSLRRSQTHDIHHVVTGFGTDPSGELGLQAFQLAQMRSPLAIAILSANLVYALADLSTLNSYIQHIYQGWEMGLKAKPLLAQKWEEHWEKPLAQWRTELGLERETASRRCVTTA